MCIYSIFNIVLVLLFLRPESQRVQMKTDLVHVSSCVLGGTRSDLAHLLRDDHGDVFATANNLLLQWLLLLYKDNLGLLVLPLHHSGPLLATVVIHM